MRRVLALLVSAATACYVGVDAEETPPPPADDGTDAEPQGDGPQRDVDSPPSLPTHAGLRRLTLAEYDNALRDLLNDHEATAAAFLPADALGPFDNDHTTQAPSEALVLGAEKLAGEAAVRLLADRPRLEALVGCTPEHAGDTACLRDFIARFGRRAFRRPLADDEVDAYARLHALGEKADDWHVSAAAVVRAMLQDPNFFYRVEIGDPIAPDIVQLDDFEIATRLSFFLWGTIPDDDLLDLAEDGGLSSAADVRDAATAMLEDPRARDAVDRFHALWLGYSRLSDEGLAADMRQESDALVEQVVFEDAAPWLSILTRTRTFVTPDLARHYGLPVPDAPRWVDYGDSGRGGILAHGTALALGAKFDDTSPTTRGLELQERLFCATIEVPAELGVSTDDPPGVDPEACKRDRYAAHREDGVCAGCHALLDGVGFGLENYDASGAFRTHDPGKPQCEIEGRGELPGVGSFNGPAELGALLVDVPVVHACAVRQLYRFAAGHAELDDLDEAFLSTLPGGRELRLHDLLIDIAASDAFRFRVVQEES